jgi:hypothetical protein
MVQLHSLNLAHCEGMSLAAIERFVGALYGTSMLRQMSVGGCQGLEAVSTTALSMAHSEGTVRRLRERWKGVYFSLNRIRIELPFERRGMDQHDDTGLVVHLAEARKAEDKIRYG